MNLKLHNFYNKEAFAESMNEWEWDLLWMNLVSKNCRKLFEARKICKIHPYQQFTFTPSP